MEEIKKPKMLAAVLLTIASVCSLISLILKTANSAFLLLQLITTCFLLFCTIGLWIQYGKQYIDYKVNITLKSNNKED